MPMLRSIAAGDTYQPAAGEHLLRLQNTADVPLYIGIRKDEYMIAAIATDPQVTYVLTEEQWVRLQQRLRATPIYQNWIARGILTLTEVTELPTARAPAA